MGSGGLERKKGRFGGALVLGAEIAEGAVVESPVSLLNLYPTLLRVFRPRRVSGARAQSRC